MKFPYLTLGLCSLAASASAQVIRDCETFEANARNIYPPYEETIRHYANGDIRLIALDVGEPAAASFHLMVTHPAGDEPYAACTLISANGNLGFGGLVMEHMRARYDTDHGLVLSVPYTTWLENDQTQHPGELTVIVNQATGIVTADGLGAGVVEPQLEPEPSK